MESIELGNSGISSSRIGLGTWAIGGWMWGGTDEAQAIATIHAALDRGITLIDTAPVYGFGTAEQIVGRALAAGGMRRRAILATKAGQRTQLTVLAYGALCRGLLSGRIRKDTQFNGDDLRRADPKFADAGRRLQYLNAVEELNALAHERFGRDVLALAVRWVLDRGPTVALWGARRPDQLDAVSGVLGWTLDAPALRAIDDILQRNIRAAIGPEFMAPPPRATAGGEPRRASAVTA
jgi:aryl-alcohol dehydrogenase-like predicted oxidoreductase